MDRIPPQFLTSESVPVAVEIPTPGVPIFEPIIVVEIVTAKVTRQQFSVLVVLAVRPARVDKESLGFNPVLGDHTWFASLPLPLVATCHVLLNIE